MEAHQPKQQDILKEFSSDEDKGLTAEDARQRLEEHGPNEISRGKRISPLMILLHQFKSPVVYLLLLAMGLSLFFQEWLDAIAIGVVILLNAVIGFIMEFQA